MSKLGLGSMVGVPLVVIAATLFLCTEHVFPHAQYCWALYF